MNDTLTIAAMTVIAAAAAATAAVAVMKFLLARRLLTAHAARTYDYCLAISRQLHHHTLPTVRQCARTHVRAAFIITNDLEASAKLLKRLAAADPRYNVVTWSQAVMDGDGVNDTAAVRSSGLF